MGAGSTWDLTGARIYSCQGPGVLHRGFGGKTPASCKSPRGCVVERGTAAGRTFLDAGFQPVPDFAVGSGCHDVEHMPLRFACIDGLGKVHSQGSVDGVDRVVHVYPPGIKRLSFNLLLVHNVAKAQANRFDCAEPDQFADR